MIKMRSLLTFDQYKIFEAMLGPEDKPSKLKIKKDKETGEKVIDKSKVPLDSQIKELAKDLYKVTIQSGRFQSIMMDKLNKMQQMGADEGVIEQFQSMMQDQMMAIQTRQMDIEMQMMSLAGQNLKMADLAQKLSGESKFLANKANDEWFKARAEKMEKDVEKDMIRKQKEEEKKEQEKEREKDKEESSGGKKEN